MELKVKKINVGEVINIKKIYQEKQYERYLFNDYRLYDTFRNSVTFGLFDGKKMVGLIRLVGDFQYVIYIEDMITLDEYSNTDAKKLLIEEVLERYAKVEKIFCNLKYRSKETASVYLDLGFAPADENELLVKIKE
ncbi:MAG TPA: hypothetical protein PKY72_05840 [Bacilli bacterium]|jgi:hypothetical protein|nr:hypothetical protein [Bacilli bacterium]HQQ39802.1 hypothetical protein [Bacilli bacterium]